MRNPVVSNLRFLCVFFMSYVHIFYVQDFYDLIFFGHQLPYLIHGYPAGTLLVLVQDGFGRISSPLLGLLSGFYAVRNLESRTYRNVVSRRFMSLYVPAVLWSTIYFGVRMAAALASSFMGDGSHIAEELNRVDINSFLGLTAWPLNGPLHYLIDLFKCVLFLPVLLYLLDRLGRKGYALIVAAFYVFLIANDFHDFSSGFNKDNILPRADLVLFFSFGVYAGRVWGGDIMDVLNRFSMRRVWAIALTAAVFVAGALHWRWLATMENDVLAWCGILLGMAVRVSGCLLIVSALDWIAALARRGIVVDETLTFRYFCTHMIAFFIARNIVRMTVGEQVPWSYQVDLFFVLPVIAFAGAYVLNKTLAFTGTTARHVIAMSPSGVGLVTELRAKIALALVPAKTKK